MSVTDPFAGLSPKEREAVLSTLDRMAQPMTVRDIDRALALAGGTTRAQRRPLLRALEDLNIISITLK